jgi:hypothetical protein
MSVEDYYPQGKRYWLRFSEKNGKQHKLPAHHTLEEYLDAYLYAAGIAEDGKGPLFRTATQTASSDPERNDDRKKAILSPVPLPVQLDLVVQCTQDAGDGSLFHDLFRCWNLERFDHSFR